MPGGGFVYTSESAYGEVCTRRNTAFLQKSPCMSQSIHTLKGWMACGPRPSYRGNKEEGLSDMRGAWRPKSLNQYTEVESGREAQRLRSSREDDCLIYCWCFLGSQCRLIFSCLHINNCTPWHTCQLSNLCFHYQFIHFYVLVINQITLKVMIPIFRDIISYLMWNQIL